MFRDGAASQGLRGGTLAQAEKDKQKQRRAEKGNICNTRISGAVGAPSGAQNRGPQGRQIRTAAFHVQKSFSRAAWHALGRYPAILVHTLGVLRMPFGQVACSQPISCHPLGIWRGQVACSQQITCHPLPCPRCSARDVWAGSMLSLGILPSFEHLAGRLLGSPSQQIASTK